MTASVALLHEHHVNADNAAVKELRRAAKRGAPYTDPGHVRHDALLRLERAGVVRRAGQIGERIFWAEE